MPTPKSKTVVKKSVPKKIGRPSPYTEELADEICMALATSIHGIAKLCEMNPHWPRVETIKLWRIKNEVFSTKYAVARNQQLDFQAEEIEDLAGSTEKYHDEKGVRRADPGLVAETRLLVDTRKWIASKLVCKKYGDKQSIEQTVTTKSETTEAVKAAIKELYESHKSDI